MSQRRACQVLTQPRATQRYILQRDLERESLVERIVALATRYGRYGYRRVTAILRSEGWMVNHKRVERIWRLEGLKVPSKQPKKGRLWLNDGSCIKLRPEYRDHMWSYDFVAARTSDGKAFRILVVIDEHTRECLTMVVKRSITSQDVLERLYMLFLVRGVPEHIRSDNGVGRDGAADGRTAPAGLRHPPRRTGLATFTASGSPSDESDPWVGNICFSAIFVGFIHPFSGVVRFVPHSSDCPPSPCGRLSRPRTTTRALPHVRHWPKAGLLRCRRAGRASQVRLGCVFAPS